MPPFSDPSGGWPVMLLRGVLALLLGLLTLFVPQAALATLVLLFAAYMLADGVLAIAAGVRAARRGGRWGWFALEGAAGIGAGVVALLWPGLTVLAFVALAAAWALLSGGFMLMGAWRFSQRHGRGWMIAGALVSIAWGLALLVWPGPGALVLTLWLGAYAAAFGLVLLAMAWRLRREARQPQARQPAPPPPAAG